jgi:hypothetical protein
VLAGLLAAAALVAAFTWVEGRAPAPLLDLSLLRLRRFLGIQLLAAAPAYAFVVLLVLLPLRFAGIEGLRPASPAPAWRRCRAAAALAPGRRPRHALVGAATLCSGGLLLAALGLLWLSHAGSAHEALPAMVLIGVGISAPWGLMDGLAVSMVPPERAGMAAGLFHRARGRRRLALAVVGLGPGLADPGAAGPGAARAAARAVDDRGAARRRPAVRSAATAPVAAGAPGPGLPGGVFRSAARPGHGHPADGPAAGSTAAAGQSHHGGAGDSPWALQRP